MTEIICDYCKTSFSNIYTLNNHQKKAKYCLILQSKIVKEEKREFKCGHCNKILSSKQNLDFHTKKCEIVVDNILLECEYCNKILSTKQNLYNHQLTCIDKKNKEIEELKEQLKELENLKNLKIINERTESQLEELKEQLKELEKLKNLKIINETIESQLVDYKNQIKELEKLKNLKIINETIESQLEDYKKQNTELQKTIERLSLRAIDKPTTTNNTVNNTLNISGSIDFNNIDRIKDKINEDYNINYAVNGQRGIAQFLVDKVLTDDNGKLIYICTDPSRHIFKYKDNDGEIKKDVEAKKLTNYIVNGGIKRKTVEISEKWYTDEDGNMDMEKFSIMMDPQQNVIKLKEDNTIFKKELASMTVI